MIRIAPKPFRFRDVVVTHVELNEFHVVSPWVESDAEAIRLARATWSNTALWEIGLRIDDLTKMIVCAGCSARLFVAYGESAGSVTTAEAFNVARENFWTVNPKPKCPVCSERKI